MPLALHIPHVVEQVGSLAGFAAVIGLAVLSALYFSQARDLRRLREWAGRAPERAAEGAPGVPGPIPGRVVATPQKPQQGQPPQPAGQPQPASGASNGDAAPSVTATPGAPVAAGQAGKPAEGDAAANKPEGDGDATASADEGETKAADGDAAKPDDGDAKPGQPSPLRPPGMPAPASAAAAAGAGSAAAQAGAGAASVAGPKAPEAPAPAAPGAGTPNAPAQGGPKPPAPGTPTPQRPPGSVLPPRTGTLPPVRRLPSSNVGASQTSVLGPSPAQQKKKRNPLYVVLAVVGVLVLGAAAAIGVPALVNGSKDDNAKKTAKTKSGTTSTKTAAATSPGKITVAVLNGTSIPGLAAQVGDRVEADGFRKGTISNASLTNGQRANSVVMYASGHAKDARLVAKKLSIATPVQPIDSSTQGIAGDASVVVVVGTDKTQ